MTVVAPRVRSFPPFEVTRGAEAAELAASCGLVLDAHQRLVVDHMLGFRADGKFAAFEVCCLEPRQNGKGSIQEARELAGIELLGERLLIHSAHEYATALEAFYRMLALVEEGDLRVQRVRNAHGEQGIDFVNGTRLRYRTRTRGGGRGFSCDYLGLDEAMMLPEFAHSALLPTMSARPNPQVGYFASAVDQDVHEHGIVLARVRERGHVGDDPSLAYFEWSLDFGHPDEVPADVASDPDAWAETNPALGDRITAEHVAHEQRSMSPRNFAVERLGVGDWPSTTGEEQLISRALWAQLEDAKSKAADPLVFCFDVTPDRSRAAIGVAGRRKDGRFHIEVVDHRRGTGWVVDRVVELSRRHSPMAVVCDNVGPAASIAPTVEQAGVRVEMVGAHQHGQSCGAFFDAVHQDGLRHLGHPELNAAVWGASTRPIGDAGWAWSRKSSKVDISPLVAVTLAFGHLARRPAREPMFAAA